jgi:hypothetical protein
MNGSTCERCIPVASKEMIARVHLLPLLGDRSLDAISTERVQQLKATLTARAPKTVNNVLTLRAIQELAGHADLRTTQRPCA